MSLRFNNRILFQIGILCILASKSVAVDQSEPNTPPSGFIAIFNGRDLSGWKGLVGDPMSRLEMSEEELTVAQSKANKLMREHWKVVDGALFFDGKGDNLCTEKEFRDSKLYVDFKILPQGDSGIYLRGSPQIQIWDITFEKYATDYGADKGTGALWNNKHHPKFPFVHADKPVGAQNRFYIKMVGAALPPTSL